jgi:DNA-binding response OmpR family regulator
VIAEDNAEHAWLLQIQINKLHCLSSVCLDPFIIIEKVKKGIVDAVIVDINMPVINGIELIKMIRKVDKELKIIVVTAQQHEDTRIKAMGAGANYYITKPYQMNELKYAIDAKL